MSRRPGKAASVETLRYRATADEAAAHKALAEYLEVTLSDLIRDLMAQKRRTLVAEGKRPPLKPRDET